MANETKERGVLRFFRLDNNDSQLEDENRFLDFYEQRNFSEEKSKELHDRAKVVVKRSKELKKGIKMLPDDLPEEFRKAIDGAIDNLTEDIQNEAGDIFDTADEIRSDTDNALYALRRESEKYERKLKNIEKLRSVPILGSFSGKNADLLYSTLDELMELSTDTNTYYESLLYSKNMVKDLVKKDEPKDDENSEENNKLCADFDSSSRSSVRISRNRESRYCDCHLWL
jgi:hypothetical protein